MRRTRIYARSRQHGRPRNRSATHRRFVPHTSADPRHLAEARIRSEREHGFSRDRAPNDASTRSIAGIGASCGFCPRPHHTGRSVTLVTRRGTARHSRVERSAPCSVGPKQVRYGCATLRRRIGVGRRTGQRDSIPAQRAAHANGAIREDRVDKKKFIVMTKVTRTWLGVRSNPISVRPAGGSAAVSWFIPLKQPIDCLDGHGACVVGVHLKTACAQLLGAGVAKFCFQSGLGRVVWRRCRL